MNVFSKLWRILNITAISHPVIFVFGILSIVFCVSVAIFGTLAAFSFPYFPKKGLWSCYFTDASIYYINCAGNGLLSNIFTLSWYWTWGFGFMILMLPYSIPFLILPLLVLGLAFALMLKMYKIRRLL